MALSTVRSQAEAREELERMEQLRKRAARQAAIQLADTVAVKMVRVRILPMGDGKVSMGQHIAGIGDVYYERGETSEPIPEPVAQDLEAKGYVEIVHEKAPKAEKPAE